ncbi:hypothetical protein HYZ06_00765 [Candidatus Daviesbacteria bacterium]|nr:hypothetical protein [Candidatus Daviesbacteria bacterium]
MAEGQPEQRRFTKISEKSEAYRDHQEVRDSIQDPIDYAFGADIASHRKNIGKLPEFLQPRFEATQKRKLGRARAKLQSLAHHRRFERYLGEFIRESLLDNNLGLLANTLKGGGRPDFKKVFDVKGIPNKILESMIIAHVQRFETQLNTFDTQIQAWNQQFKQQITEKIDGGAYPISPETLERRLRNTKVVLGDALRDDLTSDRGGQFDVEKETAMIAQQELRRRGEKVYTHEMFHALSGRTLVAKQPEPTPYSFGGVEFNAQRIGLRFQADKMGRFRWLNEAVTEHLAQDLLSLSDSAYAPERELFRLLQQQGKTPIPEDLFIGAYFENYDPDLPYGERIPAWKKLYGAINDVYSPGFLVRLDNYVKANGVEKAVEVMKHDWREMTKIKATRF